MKIRLNVVDRSGEPHDVEASVQGSLMEALRELDYGITAICGGMCSCATCHVYIANDWMCKLPTQHSDERDLVGELQHYRENSRLACQIKLEPAFDGLRVTLAPDE